MLTVGFRPVCMIRSTAEEMAAVAGRVFVLLPRRQRCRGITSHHDSTETALQRSIRAAIEARDYAGIPRLLSNPNHHPDPNPFAFLSLLPPPLAARIVDDLLQSFLRLRPRSLSHPAFPPLLSLTLPPAVSPRFPVSLFFPLALTVLQAAIRSGLPPPASARLPLALSWLHLRRRLGRHPAAILSSVRHLGRRPDLRAANHLLSALCAASQALEAAALLRSMPAAGLDPDSGSYCVVIEAMVPSPEAEGLLREMVAGRGMAPRRGTVARVVAGMRGEGEARRAAELVRFLELEGCGVGREGYEAAARRCLEGGEVVLAGRVVAEMAGRGLIPCMKVRRRVVEGLAGIGQPELAVAIRHRLAEIGS